ncbi:MAG: MFS transporter [Chthonomonas sp.]|nr:MFS transporter [Chthonomonas sp.]
MAPSRLYPLITFGMGLGYALFWTVALYFQDKVVGILPFQMVLLGTFSEITIFLCEIPTGIVADLYSRKLSVIIGLVLLGIGFFVQPFFASWAGLVVGMVLWGLGETFLSGAFEAWVADELPHEPGAPSAPTMFIRGSQSQQLGYVAGLWVAVIVGQHNLAWPGLASGGVFAIMAVMALVLMSEKGFHRAAESERSTWQHFGHTLRTGLAIAGRKPLLRDALMVVFFIGLASEAFDRLWTKHITNIGMPQTLPSEIYWFAILNTLAIAGAFCFMTMVRRRGMERDGWVVIRLIRALLFALIAATLAFALAGQFWLAAAGLVIGRAIRRCLDPLTSAWVNDHAEPEVRATMLSMKGQSHGLGELLGGPALGAISSLRSVSAALIASALTNTPGWLTAWRASQRKKAADQ